MRVVVTGGAGFIGANLCRALLADDLIGEVVVIDDLSTGSRSNLEGLPLEVVEGSVLDLDLLSSVSSGAHAIVHLAAVPSVPRSIKDPQGSHRANATGTLMVLEAARRIDNPFVIVASSSSIYGANPHLPKHEELVPSPMSPYAVSKLAAEQYALAYHHSYGIRVLTLRFFNVFGPYQPAGHAYAAVIPAFLSAALKGEPLTIYGDGKQTRDFTFVDTVTSVIVAAVKEHVQCPQPVNLAYGTRTDLLELVGIIEGLLDEKLEVRHADPRPGDVRDSQADNSRLTKLFPDIKPSRLDEGLGKTIDWFRTLT